MNNVSRRTVHLVQLALFCAIIFMLAMIPGLGYIPVGPINATTIHIPVIIGSILLGPVDGAFLGFVFGCTSLINATINPNVTSFIFSPFYSANLGETGSFLEALKSILVCFGPRILIGVVPFFVYKFIKKVMKSKKGSCTLSLILAGIAGSMTNTLLVMSLIYILFGNDYARAIGIGADALLGVILTIVGTNGIVEAIVASIIATSVCRVFLSLKVRNFKPEN